jgi:hypothetical protein
MMKNALKLVVEAGLLTITGLVWPNARYGAAIGIGVCILAALALHFFAP